MNVTGEYRICSNHQNDNSISLILNFHGICVIELLLPNIRSLSCSGRYMAIELKRVKYGSYMEYDIDKFIDNNKTACIEIDSGRIEANYVSESKSELLLLPEEDNQLALSLVMIIPSWGRWTATRLWNIIVK